MELSQSRRLPHGSGGSALEADSASWSVGVMERLGGAPTTTMERMATNFDELRPGPRLGQQKARAGGAQARTVLTATELFEVLDAEARIACADLETNHWELGQLGPDASAEGDSSAPGRAMEDDSDGDDEPLPSLDEGLGADDSTEMEPSPEPRTEAEATDGPEEPEGKSSAVAAAAGLTLAAAESGHEHPLAPFSDEEDEPEPEQWDREIYMDGADLSPVGHDEAGRFDDGMSLTSFASSLPEVSTASNFGGGSRFGDDGAPSAASAEPFLRHLRAATSAENFEHGSEAVATGETTDLTGSRDRESHRSSIGEQLSRLRRTSSHFQAISRLSSHTAASAAKRAERSGAPVVEREEYFADRTGRPELFAEARQEYFRLVKDKQAMAQAEGYDAPAVDSPRNAFVENLIAPFRKFNDGDGSASLNSSFPATRAGRAAQAAREQRLAHTAALESGETRLEEDLILSMLGPSVVDVMPELRAHQLQVAPMPLLIGRDFPRNHTVALAHYRLGDTLGAAFASGLARLAAQVTIKKLLLSQCTLGPAGTSAIAAAVSHCDSLTHLDLSNNPIGEQGADALATVLGKDAHHVLRTLELSKCELSDVAASSVIRSLHKNKTLESLDLRHNGIGRGSQAHFALAQLLTRNGALRTLLLGWNSIHGVRSDEFLNALRYNTHITHLDLSWNTIGSRGASCLGWSLRFNTALVSLDLTHNDIGERGGFVLADTLQENSTLEKITLDKNPLGQIGGAALLRGLRAYEALGVDRVIEIQQCNFDAKEYADEEMQQSSHESLHGRTFDPMEPAGVWVCRLDDPYGRAVANGLAELAWQEDEQNWDDEKTKLDGSLFDLPEPDRGIVWTRDQNSSILPEEGVLEIHYRSTLRRPRMSDVMAAVAFEAMVVMMSDRTLTDHGMALVRLGANNFLFSAAQVGSLVRHFPDAASRIEMVSRMLPQVVDQVNATSEVLDRLTEHELRGVEVKMGDFFYFVPGNPTGHYRLELGHRLARAQAMRLIAINCDEKSRRYGDLSQGHPGPDAGEEVGVDVSERGDLDIFRNETLTDSKTDPKTGKRLPGKRRRYNIDSNVAAEGNLPKFGLLEFDVSSTNVDHLITAVDPMADEIFQCLIYDLRLVKVFCATAREKTIKGPLLFQLAADEDKFIREKFQRARESHHSWKRHMQSLRDAATASARHHGFLSEQLSLEALTHVRHHHSLDATIVQKVREAAEHAPLRLKRSISKDVGAKIAAGYDHSPTEALEMFAAVPHIAPAGGRGKPAGGGADGGAPKPMKLSVLHQVISKIYEEKVQADAIADEHSRVRQSLPDFIVEYFQDKYDIKPLAERHIKQLVASVRHHAKPILALKPPSKKKHDESEDEDGNQGDFDPRVDVFGRLSGILGGKETYSACNVNFVMDLLGMLIVDHEDIDETLNDEDLNDRSLPLNFVEKAVRRNYVMRRQSAPAYLRQVLLDSSFMAQPGHLLAHNASALGRGGSFRSSRQLVQQVDVDHALLLALRLWLQTMEAGEKLVKETFLRVDK